MSRLVDEYGFTLYDTAIDEMSENDYRLIGTLRNIKKNGYMQNILYCKLISLRAK